jgi:hypothetical protein
MLVLRLDHLISGISLDEEIAGSTQLLTGQGFHDARFFASNSAVHWDQEAVTAMRRLYEHRPVLCFSDPARCLTGSGELPATT